MSNSINYTEKDFNTIFKEAIQNAQNLQLISEDENFINHINELQDIENFYVLDLSVISNIISYAFKHMTQVYNSNDIDKATGKDLDTLGELFNIQRPEAQSSIVELTFYLSTPAEQDITIPEGTIVQTKNQDQYSTTETVIILQGSTQTTVNAKSVNKGYLSRVNPDTLTTIITTINTNNKTIHVTNPQMSTGGKNEATDDEYRELIRDWSRIHHKGTKSAYEYFFTNYEGINGYHLIPQWDGTGTLKIIIDPDNDRIIRDIQEQLLENVQMYDDDVKIVGATRKQIDINCTVNVDIDETIPYSAAEKEDIKLRVENSIKTYVLGGYKRDGSYHKGLTIGEDFIAHKCYVFVDSEIPELKLIKFNNFDEYYPVDDEEIIEVGSVNVNIE